MAKEVLYMVGERWSAIEESQLIALLKSDTTLFSICMRHHRSTGGILSRAWKLGLVTTNKDKREYQIEGQSYMTWADVKDLRLNLNQLP